MTIFCLLVAVAGCGDGSGKRHAEGLLDCLRDSGATVKAMPRPTFPPAIEEYKVTLNSGGFDYAFVDVLRSEAEARRRLRPSASAVRKGRILVGYAGSRAHDAALLESCLRSSAEGGGLRPGALVLRARREAARRSAAIKRRNAAIKRQRSAGYGSFTTPAAITRELERLRRFRRYTLYYAGRRVAGLPLTAVVSVLQEPPAYKRVPPGRSPKISFIYGSCEPSPEGGCAATLEIQNFEICAINPHSYGLPPHGSSRFYRSHIRGVPEMSTPGVSSGLDLYTGHTTIRVIRVPGGVAAPGWVALDLRSLDGRIGPRSKLPPPAPGALEGRLRCHRPPAHL
jgi:hypothetical protein